jgi:hypothetical protein
MAGSIVSVGSAENCQSDITAFVYMTYCRTDMKINAPARRQLTLGISQQMSTAATDICGQHPSNSYTHIQLKAANVMCEECHKQIMLT